MHAAFLFASCWTAKACGLIPCSMTIISIGEMMERTDLWKSVDLLQVFRNKSRRLLKDSLLVCGGGINSGHAFEGVTGSAVYCACTLQGRICCCATDVQGQNENTLAARFNSHCTQWNIHSFLFKKKKKLIFLNAIWRMTIKQQVMFCFVRTVCATDAFSWH